MTPDSQYRRFTANGHSQLEVGAYPVVVPDSYYDAERGLVAS